MEIHLKINDVVGMDDQKRHILRVDGENILKAIKEHDGWVKDLVTDYLKHHPKMLSQVIDDPTLRNVIYNEEKQKREAKAERRERHKLYIVEKQRREDQHRASIATRKALDFFRDVLGVDDEEA